MDLGDGLGHLTYSTLVHPGDTWDEMSESLMTFVPRVKRRVGPAADFGVSLRLSAASAHRLHGDAGRRRALRDHLDAEGLYVYTVNAFPYGPFKGRSVKEQVYEPDWNTPDRVRYTCEVADVLAEVSPGHVDPSIQSAPLAFARNVHDETDVQGLTRNLMRVVAHLLDLERRTGRRVTLALEPEPACYLETTRETVAYFQRYVYSAAGARTLGELAGVAISEAHAALRRHLGVVFDVGHQAVGFEDIPASLAELEDAGIPVFKLQAAAALRVPEVTPQVVAELERLTETIYLSQTTELRDGALRKFLNLEDAIAAWHEDGGEGTREWRTHFHVPVFLENLGPFETTRFALEEALRVHALRPQSAHLEIETYTWDVLPEQYKDGDIVDYLTRELQWVRDRLAGERARPAATAGRA
jgi:hypothetical protein